MNLNNIELPASLVAELYGSSLVELQDLPVTPQPETVEETGWKFLGGNRKNILIIVEYPGFAFLPDDRLAFLTEILTACKLTLADIAIFNLAKKEDAPWKKINEFFKPRNVLLFAVEPAVFGLPMSFPFFQVQPFADASFLYSPALEDLEKDKLLKSKLWVCLKRLFKL
jgi:hypothetical protein